MNLQGDTEDPGINALRQRQMKNLMLALLVSQGTPMVLSGQYLLLEGRFKTAYPSVLIYCRLCSLTFVLIYVP